MEPRAQSKVKQSKVTLCFGQKVNNNQAHLVMHTTRIPLTNPQNPAMQPYSKAKLQGKAFESMVDTPKQTFYGSSTYE